MTLNSLGLTSRLEWYYEHSNSLPKSWDIYVSNVIPGGLLSLSETKIHEIVYGSDYGRSGITFDTLGDESRQLLENIKGGPIPNVRILYTRIASSIFSWILHHCSNLVFILQ